MLPDNALMRSSLAAWGVLQCNDGAQHECASVGGSVSLLVSPGVPVKDRVTPQRRDHIIAVSDHKFGVRHEGEEE